jgi:uncharacterized protein (DUF58 family)
MLTTLLPSRTLIGLFAMLGLACTGLAFAGWPAGSVALIAAAAGAVLCAAVALDAAWSICGWRRAPLTLERQLPQAFAVGRNTPVRILLDNPAARRRRGQLFDGADATLEMPDMPLRFDVPAGRRATLEFNIRPTARGLKRFAAAQIRLRSNLGLLDWNLRLGADSARRVFPNFEQPAAAAWLSGERRLSDLGVKAVRRRGAGTDFDQLTDYRAGDPLRHIDWKATLKHERPIARRFQDERDQRIMLVLDCGRRMRADDAQQGIGTTHFDQALNALMLLAFVALKSGDAVGAATFGTATDAARRFAPRKGRQTLNALMAALGDIEPTPTFSDYSRFAADFVGRQRKRALIVLITNCREEDAAELTAALAVLRTRHLVVLANLREHVIDEIADQPLNRADSALEVAAALDYRQQRSEMLRRLAVGGTLIVDCVPERLAAELVQRYTVLKRAGAI